jgi:beta-phosphoglucomutase-like phosphatase (HAD superfamily)
MALYSIQPILSIARAGGCAVGAFNCIDYASIRAIVEAAVEEDAPVISQVLAGDIVARKKPYPDIYLLALERLRLPAMDCLVIEDSQIGLRAATAAGIPCMITTSTYSAGESFPGSVRVVPELGDPPGAHLRLSDLADQVAAVAKGRTTS